MMLGIRLISLIYSASDWWTKWELLYAWPQLDSLAEMTSTSVRAQSHNLQFVVGSWVREAVLWIRFLWILLMRLFSMIFQYVLNFPPRRKIWGNCHMKSEQYIFSSFFQVQVSWGYECELWTLWSEELDNSLFLLGPLTYFSFHLTYLVWTFPLKVIMVLALRNICSSAF